MIVYNPGGGSTVPGFDSDYGGGQLQQPADYDWESNEFVEKNSVLKNAETGAFGLHFLCLESGFTGLAEPTWPTMPYRTFNGQPLEGYVRETSRTPDGRARMLLRFTNIGNTTSPRIGTSDEIGFEIRIDNIDKSFPPNIVFDIPGAFAAGHVYGYILNSPGEVAAYVAAELGSFTDLAAYFTFETSQADLPADVTPANAEDVWIVAKDTSTSFSVNIADNFTYYESPSGAANFLLGYGDSYDGNIPRVSVIGGAVWGGISSLFERLSAVSPSAIIELYELHLSANVHGSDQVYYFTAMDNGLGTGVIFGGQQYISYPILAEGFEWNGTGTLPRPTIRVSNHQRLITQMMAAANVTTPGNDLSKAKFVRRRTLARYLDNDNFHPYPPAWLQPNSDAQFPPDIFFLDRLTAETRDIVEFEAAAATDLHGIRMPKRQCISNICQWVYRGDGCGYNGKPCATSKDEPIVLTTENGFSTYAQSYTAAESILISAKARLDAARTALSSAENDFTAAERDWLAAGEIYNLKNGTYVEIDNLGQEVAYRNFVQVPLGGQYRRGTLIDETFESSEDSNEFYTPGRKRYSLLLFSGVDWQKSQTLSTSSYVRRDANGTYTGFLNGQEIELGGQYQRGALWYQTQEYYQDPDDDEDDDDD